MSLVRLPGAARRRVEKEVIVVHTEPHWSSCWLAGRAYVARYRQYGDGRRESCYLGSDGAWYRVPEMATLPDVVIHDTQTLDRDPDAAR